MSQIAYRSRALSSGASPRFTLSAEIDHRPHRPLRIRYGERLRHLRETNRYTQKQLADYLGIDRSFISDVERGKKNLSLSFAETIAQGFNVSLADFLRDI
jgi:DNA-binding XRE family transcriptional regulator